MSVTETCSGAEVRATSGFCAGTSTFQSVRVLSSRASIGTALPGCLYPTATGGPASPRRTTRSTDMPGSLSEPGVKTTMPGSTESPPSSGRRRQVTGPFDFLAAPVAGETACQLLSAVWTAMSFGASLQARSILSLSATDQVFWPSAAR